MSAISRASLLALAFCVSSAIAATPATPKQGGGGKPSGPVDPDSSGGAATRVPKDIDPDSPGGASATVDKAASSSEHHKKAAKKEAKTVDTKASEKEKSAGKKRASDSNKGGKTQGE